MKKQLLQTSLFLLILFFNSCSFQTKHDEYNYDLIPVEKDGKWGYIDHEGKWIINPQFHNAKFFSQGRALVQSSDEKFGYIDEKGNYIINAQYVSATPFAEDYAIVVPENGYPTCIDRSGKVRFSIKGAEEMTNFQEGMALVKVAGKYGYVDENGKIVIDPKFDYAWPFSEGIAVYAIKDKNDSTNSIKGFINNEGEIIVNAQFATLSSLVEGSAYASSDGKKFGFVDRDGKYIINPEFDEVNHFSEGLAAVKQGDNWGYINSKGKLVINPQFEEVGIFLNGIAAVRTAKDSWGYVDAEGKMIINSQFGAAASFTSDIACVVSGKKVGLINREGKYLVNPQFNDVAGYYTDNFYPQFRVEPLGQANSDYFDGDALARVIIGDVSGGSGIRGMNATTTYTALKDMLPADADPLALSNELIDYKGISISTGIDIQKVSYNFARPLKEYKSGFITASYDYVPGGYVTDNSAPLASVELNISLLDWGISKRKAYKLGDAIKAALIKAGGVSEVGTDENSNIRSREAIAKFLNDVNTDEREAKAIFLFGKKCQYMILSRKKENEIQVLAVFSESTSYMPSGSYKES